MKRPLARTPGCAVAILSSAQRVATENFRWSPATLGSSATMLDLTLSSANREIDTPG